ncbi:MAG: class I SAM-dependent methyltransferase [Nanoarchaeota archaeon]
MGWQPERGHHTRSRSLGDLEKRFGPCIVRKTISKAKKLEDKVRVLEIGCGEGRVLMELRKLFPDIELYGINKEPWPAMKGTESLRKTAEHYNIFSKNELGGIFLPEISFENAEKLNFPCNYFDLIISQFAVPYIERKDIFLEEAWRTLKKGGSALIHIDTYDKTYPDFMQCKTPRFIIHKNNKEYQLKKFMGDIAKTGYDLNCKSVKGETTITMNKNHQENLILHLGFDELSSFELSLLNEKNPRVFWGYRSVYRI